MSMMSMESAIKIPGIQQLERNGTTRWQVYHNKKYLGYFSTFDAAVKAKADAMEMEIEPNEVENEVLPDKHND